MKKYGNYDSIAFPIGGIGAGSISLKANGALCDFEIFNRPSRRTVNPFAHFAVKAESDERVLDCRVLQGDFADGFMGNPSSGSEVWVYGNGKDRMTLAGARHFENAEFSAFYPTAEIGYSDSAFPGKITLDAFNPFIPMNSDDSSLPAAFFEITFFNDTDKDIDYTAALSVSNPFGGERYNRVFNEGELRGILMNNNAREEDISFGNFSLVCPDGDFSYQEHWYRGGWFDELTTFIKDFSSFGPLKNRSYNEPWDGVSDVATVASTVKVKAGEKKTVRFIMSWYVPNAVKYWDSRRQTWKTYYSTLFASSKNVAGYCLENYGRLKSATELFKNTMEKQSLPACVLDAVQGNLAILKSTTCLRLEDGTFWGWEGVTEKSGSCEGTCTHVWNYAYALAYLFPDLERSVRNAEMKYSVDENGKMAFRTMLPLGSEMSSFRACADGQFGTVMKILREWKLSGDDAFLSDKWEKVKKIISYAWSENNPDRWDSERSGVLTGRQHHTLDMELFGPSSWLEGYYVGALLAGAEMAEFMGEDSLAKEYRRMAENGREYICRELFNGEYFIQKIDLFDKSVVDSFETGELINSSGYWNDEAGEIKYQVGSGCEIDQVVASWHSDLIGIGRIFPEDMRRSALESIYKYNFKSMRDISNPCRVFALDDEKGVIMCSWDASERPAIPLTYAEETMSGFEYAVACNMLQCGMEKEAFEIVSAVRERYDGRRRNPWAEIECGASYARSMSSYSLLLAYSGFFADMRKNMIGFRPLKYGKYFWSVGGAWGSAELGKGTLKLEVLYGKVTLGSIVYSFACNASAELNGERFCITTADGTAYFDKAEFKAGDVLYIN